MSKLKTLVIFDYDWSLINTNSDEFVFDEILPEQGYVVSFCRNNNVSWTAAVNAGCQKVHEYLGAQEAPIQLKQVAAEVPVQEKMLDAVKHAAADAQCDLYIISDANTIFIEEMLKRHGIYQIFENKIFTNHGEFDEQGLLHVKPFHPISEPPHGCGHCPDNMCKGKILDDVLQQQQKQQKQPSDGNYYDRIIYVGDGGGDFCPVLRLTRKIDIILARKDLDKEYGLCRRISNHEHPIQATLITWSTGHDIYNAFMEYIP